MRAPSPSLGPPRYRPRRTRASRSGARPVAEALEREAGDAARLAQQATEDLRPGLTLRAHDHVVVAGRFHQHRARQPGPPAGRREDERHACRGAGRSE